MDNKMAERLQISVNADNPARRPYAARCKPVWSDITLKKNKCKFEILKRSLNEKTAIQKRDKRIRAKGL